MNFILIAFLALVGIGFGVKSEHLESKLKYQELITDKIVDQCGENWLKKPITNKDLIDFGLIEKIDKK